MSHFIAADIAMAFAAFCFLAGGVVGAVLTAFWIYWPLISQSLFPGVIL